MNLSQSRTPDSGVYSSSSGGSLSSYSTNLSTNNINTMVSNLCVKAPPYESIDSNSNACVNGTSASVNLMDIKDSPPSSPNSEIGTGTTTTLRKGPGRKAKETQNSTINNVPDVKLQSFSNGNNLVNGIASAVNPTDSLSSLPITSATHMLGNQINPNSNVAQKLSDQLNMEIQDHSIYNADAVTPQFVGVPFPGKNVSYKKNYIY